MVTLNPEKARLITRIKADLRRKGAVISEETIEMIIESYELRRPKEPERPTW